MNLIINQELSAAIAKPLLCAGRFISTKLNLKKKRAMETIKKVTPEEYVCKIWGLEVGKDHSEFMISADMAISHINSYIEREHIGLHKDHITTTDQVNVLQKTLGKLIIGFDTEENKIDFILDICNEYKKQLNGFITESRFTE